MRNPQPIWIWKKTATIPKTIKNINTLNYNPELIIKPVYIDDPSLGSQIQIQINVVRDDYLEAGSKQRAMIPFLDQQMPPKSKNPNTA